jgi:hypothetical protein
MERDYFFRKELEKMGNEELKVVINTQWNVIENDKKYIRPNNRMTITEAEDILEERGINPYQ